MTKTELYKLYQQIEELDTLVGLETKTLIDVKANIRIALEDATD